MWHGQKPTSRPRPPIAGAPESSAPRAIPGPVPAKLVEDQRAADLSPNSDGSDADRSQSNRPRPPIAGSRAARPPGKIASPVPGEAGRRPASRLSPIQGASARPPGGGATAPRAAP